MLFNEYQRFLNCIAMLKTVQNEKEDAARLLYEFELSVLKNIERMTEDCTVKEV